MPAHLSAVEQEEFRHVLKSAPLSILTAADQALIESYCVATIAAAMRTPRCCRQAS